MRASISLLERFDRIRAENPDCGFALYAYEPRGAVTLEIMTPEVGASPYQFTGATAAEAMEAAFPTKPDPYLDPPTPEPAASPTPAASVFD
ncbi:hypothetical protein [Neorhizobium galegae]|uniref:hypothetical protein n=1 Tax=Neorhizobium galegae TaxID=399 RepID=UPI000622129F|nr:hypothetical protein [Neorhizobium galegae]CDZ55070.1 Hypothetical protein NGAL_HAMBI2427_59780 [Neorhizobium galegae bv. orientalis]